MEKKYQAWQVLAAMVAFLAWAIFIVLFALLLAGSLDLFQNIVITIASFVGAAAVGGGALALR